MAHFAAPINGLVVIYKIRLSLDFLVYLYLTPIRSYAFIIRIQALRINWEEVIPKNELSYIIGNPPFVGKQWQTKEQKEDMGFIFKGVKGAGVLDYVTAWYLRAAQYIKGTKIKVAFVSTNSISQGEQVGILWNELFNQYKVKIHFAHRTFNWSNKAKKNAAVHVVIIGFANFDGKNKKIFEYEDIKSDPHELNVKNINPYLVESGDVIISKKNEPISDVPGILFGSMPNDGGFFLFDTEEKNAFLVKEPNAMKYFRPLLGAYEFLNKKERWCLWLENISPSDLKKMPEIQKKIALVKKVRNDSSRLATRKLAEYPALFGEIRQPSKTYIAIPEVSSPYVSR